MPKVVVVTGSSRGVGAATAIALGTLGHDVVVNFREKRRRAEKVCQSVRDAGGRATPVGVDLTHPDGPQRLFDEALTEFGRVDAAVLNASGGLELGADPDYPMRVNRDAQVTLARAAAERMHPGSRIVFVTSHQAHFSQTHAVPADYAAVAASKLAGEQALRGMQPDLIKSGVTLDVVSGDMIDGTIIVRLLERRNPDAVADRRQHGPLPTVAEFAAVIARTATAEGDLGRTYYVGGSDMTGSVMCDSTGAPDSGGQ